MAGDSNTGDLRAAATELWSRLEGLDTSFDPTERLSDLEFALKQLAQIMPMVREACTDFEALLAVGVIDEIPHTGEFARHVADAHRQLQAGTLSRSTVDNLYRSAKDFSRDSASHADQAWHDFVDGVLDPSEVAFLSVLCNNFLETVGIKAAERKTAEGGKDLTAAFRRLRNGLPSNSELHEATASVRKMAKELERVRDRLIGSDPAVREFVRTASNTGVHLNDVADSVWDWIEEKGLRSAYVVLQAPGGQVTR